MRMNMSVGLPKSANGVHILGRGKTDHKGGCIAFSNAEREGSVLT